jgi:hypothetical protein
MQLVTVYTALNPVDADLVYSRLAAADFHPVIKGGLAGTSIEGYVLAAGGVDIQVPEDEVDDAHEFLSSPGEEPEA